MDSQIICIHTYVRTIQEQISFDINIPYISFLLGKVYFQNPLGWGMLDTGLTSSPYHQPYTITHISHSFLRPCLQWTKQVRGRYLNHILPLQLNCDIRHQLKLRFTFSVFICLSVFRKCDVDVYHETQEWFGLMCAMYSTGVLFIAQKSYTYSIFHTLSL